MRRSVLFVVAVAILATMAGPAGAVPPPGFASSSPTGVLRGGYETLGQDTCQGVDGEYVLRARGVEGTLSNTAPGVSGPFIAEVVQVTSKATGEGTAFGFMVGQNAWGDDWFGIATLVADLPTLKGGLIAFSETSSTLIANLSGRWKTGNRLELAFGGGPTVPNLGLEALGDDCSVFIFSSLSRMSTKLAARTAGTRFGKQVSRLGQRARAVAARPASSRIASVSDFSMELGSAAAAGGWEASVLDSCPGDDTDYLAVGTGFGGGISSSFDDFGGEFLGEAIQVVRADNGRGLVFALMAVDDGAGNAWDGFAIAVVHGQKVRGVGFFMKDGAEPAAIIANLTARFRPDWTFSLGFGDGSLGFSDFAFATEGTNCSVLPI